MDEKEKEKEKQLPSWNRRHLRFTFNRKFHMRLKAFPQQ